MDEAPVLTLPKMQPIPIPTKRVPWYVALWRWLTWPRKWLITEEWEFVMPDETLITVPEGFIFDGASIPRPLWGLLSPTGLLLTPGLVHDYAYKYNRLEGENGVLYSPGAGRLYWDRVFRDVAIHVNGFTPINYVLWWVLVLCGWKAWRGHRKREEVK